MRVCVNISIRFSHYREFCRRFFLIWIFLASPFRICIFIFPLYWIRTPPKFPQLFEKKYLQFLIQKLLEWLKAICRLSVNWLVGQSLTWLRSVTWLAQMNWSAVGWMKNKVWTQTYLQVYKGWSEYHSEWEIVLKTCNLLTDFKRSLSVSFQEEWS